MTEPSGTDTERAIWPKMRVALSSTDFNRVGGSGDYGGRNGELARSSGTRCDHLRRAHRSDGARRRRARRHINVPAKLDVYTGLGFRRRAAAAIEADRPDVHGACCGLSPLGGVFWIPVVSRVGYDVLLSRRSVIAGLPVRLNPFHRGRLWLERSMLAPGSCAGLVALTERQKADIVRIYGVPESEIDVLAPGFDPEVFNLGDRERRRAEARTRFGYKEEDRVLLFVANELERKGFDVLLEAVGLLQDPTVKILGAGHIVPDAYRSLIERLGLTDRLQWLGRLKRRRASARGR